MQSRADLVRPQRVNPGGNLDPSEVIGRDDFIAWLWDVLDRQSVRLTAERRMGKTSVVKKMRAESPSDVLAIYRSFEDVRSPLEFLDALVSDLAEHLPTTMKTRMRLGKLLDQLEVKLGKGPIQMRLPAGSGWKETVHKVFETLDPAERIVFFWDEVPVMIGAIARSTDAATAHELLDVLRVVRQTYDQARMVFTGSVGLHHVLGEIAPSNYSQAPVNDMKVTELGGLELDHGVQLARNLFAGERLRTADEAQVAQAIHIATSGIPFYIQHVVAGLIDRGGTASMADVDDVVAHAVGHSLDPWEFKQYQKRIRSYYGERRDFALAVLDIVAVAPDPLPFADVVNRVQLRGPAADEDVRDVLSLLQQDHYLVRSDDGYRFAFPIVGRAWRVQRDL